VAQALSKADTERDKQIAKLASWFTDPVLFVRECFNTEPEKWQAEALQAVVDNNRVAIRSGHGVGKTAFLSWLILWWMLTRRPVKIGCTANSKDQLRDVLWAEVHLWHNRLPDFLKEALEIQTDRVIFAEDASKDQVENFARARTARKENPEALQGLHSKYMLFIIDEASGVEEEVFEAARGVMSSHGAKTVMTGNPTRASGYFFGAFHKHRALWWTRRVSCKEVPNLVSDSFRQELIDEWGEDSNVFRYRYLGDFPISDENVVIPLNLLEAAQDRKVEISYTGIKWGVDVARFGADRTCLVRRSYNAILQPAQTWRNKDIMQVAGLVAQAYEEEALECRPEIIMVDVIGYGAGVVDRLTELGLPVCGVNVAESAAVKAKYMRLRDELWFEARHWFEEKHCRIPRDEMMVAELSGVVYDITSTGKLKVESKPEMKKRGLRSPDIADAVCLTFAKGFSPENDPEEDDDYDNQEGRNETTGY